jgi:hypothetical protein
MKQINITRKPTSYLLYVASALFAAVYFFIVYKFTVNIPISDDFPALQDFLVQYLQAENGGEKLSLLLESIGIGKVHRILLPRLMVLLVYLLTGKLNYTIYLFVVILFTSGIAIMIFKMINDKRMKPLAMLLTVTLLLNGQNFINYMLVFAGIANIGICFFAFLSMYLLLSRSRASFVGGLLLSLLTIYSNGNGMLIIPPAIIALYLQKRMKELIVFAIPCILAALFYFYGLEMSRITGGDSWEKLYNTVSYFFIFTGGCLWVPSAKFISFTAGVLCFAVYVWGILNKAYKDNLFCYACLTFLYLTIFVAAAGNQYHTVRIIYRIYSSLFLALTTILLVNNTKAFYVKKIIPVLPILAFSFSLLTIIIYRWDMQKLLEGKKVSAYNWVNKGRGLIKYGRYLREAERLGVYKMPEYPLSEYKSPICAVSSANMKFLPEGIIYRIESIDEKENFLVLEGWSYLKSMSMDHTDIYIFLTNGKNQRTYCPKFQQNSYVPDITKVKSGFFAVIDKTEIPAGVYRIEIGIKPRLSMKGDIFYVSTDKMLEI